MKHQDGVALEVDRLTKVFRDRGAREIRAVDGISFQVAPGGIVGLLGPNGAGKTTTIKCILGLVRPTSGRVTILGRDVASHYPGILSQVSAVLEGSRNLYWRMTVWENIEFFTGIHGLPRWQHRRYIEHLVERFGLAGKRDVEVRKLSQGMKQKTAVVCALAKRTPLVFLDEPTLGLDVETSYELRETLKDLLDAASIAPLLIVTLLGAYGVGFVLGGLALVFKRIQSFFQIVQFAFVGCLVIPWRIAWARFLPLSMGNGLIYRVMAEGKRLWQLPAADVLTALAVGVAYLAVGLAIFSACEKAAKNRGLLAHY